MKCVGVLYLLGRDGRALHEVEVARGVDDLRIAFGPDGLVVAADDGRVRTYDVATGKVESDWKVEWSEVRAYLGGLAVAGQSLFFGGQEGRAGRIACHDAATGSRRWITPLPGPPVALRTARDGDLLVVLHERLVGTRVAAGVTFVSTKDGRALGSVDLDDAPYALELLRDERVAATHGMELTVIDLPAAH